MHSKINIDDIGKYHEDSLHRILPYSEGLRHIWMPELHDGGRLVQQHRQGAGRVSCLLEHHGHCAVLAIEHGRGVAAIQWRAFLDGVKPEKLIGKFF